MTQLWRCYHQVIWKDEDKWTRHVCLQKLVNIEVKTTNLLNHRERWRYQILIITMFSMWPVLLGETHCFTPAPWHPVLYICSYLYNLNKFSIHFEEHCIWFFDKPTQKQIRLFLSEEMQILLACIIKVHQT